MNTEQYENKIKKHCDSFDKILEQMMKDTNEFKEENPQKTMYSMINTDKRLDGIMTSISVIKDTIEDIPSYKKKSLTYKLRKLLGYSYP